jgi:type II secretory pathway pseudopilin PulG
MTLLPQPPPNAPAPPPNAQALRSRRKMGCIIQLGILSIVLALLAGITIPQMLTIQKKAPLTQALSNARQIGLALYDFDTDYGSFPSNATIAQVEAATQSDWELKDTTSNDLFKQLFAADIVTSEQDFYVKLRGTRKPDHFVSPHSKILEEGECGFAYVLGGSTGSHPDRPIAVTPLIPGTLRFDPEPLDGFAVALHSDNSAKSYRILADGRAVDSKGVDIFDPGQPYWNGIPPEVKWPALLPPPPRTPWYREHAFAIGSCLVVTLLLSGTGVLWYRHQKKSRGHGEPS